MAVVVIQDLDYLKYMYTHGLNVSSLFSDFIINQWSFVIFLSKMDWSGLPNISVVKKIPTKYPKNLVFFALLGWVLESRRREDKRGRDWHVRLRAPYRNPSRRFTFVLKNAVVSISAALLNTREPACMCYVMFNTSPNSDIGKSFGPAPNKVL